MIPTSIFRVWFLGLFSFFLVGADVYAVRRWYHHAWSYDFEHQRSYFDPHLGFNHSTLLLAVAVGLLLWTVAGFLIVPMIFGLFSKAKGGGVASARIHDREGAVVSTLGRPDGSEIHVESFGREDAPTIVLTHGWGSNRTEWDYLRRTLADRFRLIVWDLPGLGRSAQPSNHDYGLENLAGDLEAVLGLVGDRPVVLLGHSIGGMITLTFCGQFPKELGARVVGLALVQTTYTNPLRTTLLAGLMTALEQPLVAPLLRLTIATGPLVWVMNQLSYLNGSAQVSCIQSGFTGRQTWEQVEHLTRVSVSASPAVMARGMFGMLRYDATATLKTIPVPTLVVAGDHDPVCKPSASDRMIQDIPGSRPFVLRPAKHMGLIEHNEQFADEVGRFCDACFKAAPTTSRAAASREGGGPQVSVVQPAR